MAISMGIVGLGQFGRHFVHLFKQHPDVARLAICDIRADRVAEMARQHGLDEGYGSLGEMLKSDLDAVAIITQPWLHLEQVIETLEAGKHAYSAVPSTYGVDGEALLAQCDRLIDTVRRTGQIYMLGETTYFRRETMYCRARAAQGDFGQLTYGECEYWHDLDSPSSNLREVARNRWGEQFGPDKQGGIPMHYPTHSVSSMVSVMGAQDRGAHMVSVSARGYRYPNDDWFRTDTLWGNEYSNEVALYQVSNGAIVRHGE
ncbi:MAG: Gfo/Idh/MocA family oxidoreductase, partial [Anaerolineae bacterium]|nr:Gfo/Idh/MocA family oxidoreductase [Anaerolineae bacterium]